MKINFNNLTEEFIKNVKNHRIKDMHLANHGKALDPESMGNILITAEKIGSLISIYEKEHKDND